jgi:nucleoside-diphosphate-sugar epimerase
MRVTVIGAEGFVGSAFVTHLSALSSHELIRVTRHNYGQLAGVRSDIVIDAAGNSRKYLADAEPIEEFALSVTHRLRTVLDFPADQHVHVSSADVYSDLSSPESTREDSAIDLAKVSHYGFHKLLAEQVVQHYAERWLIVRLAGMVGPGLRKNPVYDILNAQPLRIHPDSQYQFMNTGDVARIVWSLVEHGIHGEVFNLCGDGLISPAAIADIAGMELNTSLLTPMTTPRVMHIDNERIKRLSPVPSTHRSIREFMETPTISGSTPK